MLFRVTVLGGPSGSNVNDVPVTPELFLYVLTPIGAVAVFAFVHWLMGCNDPPDE